MEKPDTHVTYQHLISDVLIGASATVTAAIIGKPDTLDKYHLYTRSLGKMVDLPKVYSKTYELHAALDAIKWPICVKVKPISSNAPKALDIIEMIEDENEEENEDESE